MHSGVIGIAGGLLRLGPLDDTSNLVFFQRIYDFLRDEIDEFGVHLLGRVMTLAGSAVLSLLTLWIMIQGYRIVTGQSRESMMTLVTNSLRATLIVGIATGMAAGGSVLYDTLTTGMNETITAVVTGRDENAYASIDRSLGYMQLAMSSIDGLQVGKEDVVNDSKTRALWFTGLGIGGPAITGGTMLLLNKIAMALFIGLGPLFILCLLFDQTKPLFGRWLYYGIGTMFSLAVLSVMVALALDMVVAVSASFWVGKFLPGQEGITSMAMQQGGMGLILTMLIISAPPMAAAFFQGTLGQFQATNAFMGPSGKGSHGQQGYTGHAVHSLAPTNAGQPNTSHANPVLGASNSTRIIGNSQASQSDMIKPEPNRSRSN